MSYLNVIYIILIIFVLNIIQYFYYKILYYFGNTNFFLGFIIRFIIRFGVIVHEFCHMFFAFLSGNKVVGVELFKKEGGKVTIQTKNYIGALSQNGFNFWFFILLIFNQIGIFLISFGPLIFGIIFSILFFNHFNISDFSGIEKNYTNIYFWIYLIFFGIFVPSFVLSIEDMKKFFFSIQEGFFSSLIGSIINFLIFFCFIFILEPFIFYYLLFFTIIFLSLFLINFLIFLIVFFIKIIRNIIK